MKNEKDISRQEKKIYQNKINSLISVFQKKNISAYYADDLEDARNVVIDLIRNFSFPVSRKSGKCINIGIADSQTLHQINLFEALFEMSQGGGILINNPFDRLDDGRYREFVDLPNGWVEDPLPYEAAYGRVMEKMREALNSDIFITGANAITMNGQIISTDGVGNRLSGVIFGPYRVIMVVGRNKIVNNLDEAFDRIKNIAAPMNHLRHAEKHCRKNPDGSYLETDSMYKLSKLPCVTKGYCVDCGSNLCSRRCTMIMDSGTGGSIKNRIHLVIVNDNLGC